MFKVLIEFKICRRPKLVPKFQCIKSYFGQQDLIKVLSKYSIFVQVHERHIWNKLKFTDKF